MTFAELVRAIDWTEVEASLQHLYPCSQELLAAHHEVFVELSRLEPRPSRMRISIERTQHESPDDEPFEQVIGRDGTLNRDQKDFQASGEAPDSPFALQETGFALEFHPWEEWLGMRLDPANMDRLPAAHVVAHCLWEMTFCGFTQEEIAEELAELQRRAAEVEAMTEEERKEKLIPHEKVMEEVRSMLKERSQET